MEKKIYANLKYVGGMHFKGENKTGVSINMGSNPQDESVSGSSPMELLLQAAGGCTSMDVVFILRKRKIELDAFELELEGTKREEHPRIYESINLTYRARGAGLTVSEMERAVGLSIEKYCSVFGMLKSSAKIAWTCELID